MTKKITQRFCRNFCLMTKVVPTKKPWKPLSKKSPTMKSFNKNVDSAMNIDFLDKLDAVFPRLLTRLMIK